MLERFGFMLFARRELNLIEYALELLEKEIDQAELGCTFLGLATGLVPELKKRITLEIEKNRYKNPFGWVMI